MLHLPRNVSGLFVGHPRSGHLVPSLGLALAGGLALFTALAVGRNFVQPASPAVRPSEERIVAVVNQYLNEWQPLKDPLVTLENGAQAKSSNVKGVEIDGLTYYYRLVNAPSFDPMSLGVAGNYEVVAMMDPGTHWEVQVYRRR